MLQSTELKNKLAHTIAEFKSAQPFTQEVKQQIDDKFRLEFNFNSNHLEGNTLTYTETELLLRFDRTEGNHEFREYEEMQAHDVAYLMIETEAQDKERPLTENLVRTLNQTLLVKPYWKDARTQGGDSTRKQIIPGEYKSTPNSVILTNGTIFHYTAPADVPNEMNKLITWYNDNEELEDPITLAATLHYKFVRIHPFDDGNGRTARLLMNYVLLRSGLPVVIIKAEEKKDYLSALNKADSGDIQYFVDYIANQLLWSINIQLKASRGETIEEEDDVEKELSILRRKLASLPDEFDQEKSKATILEMVNKSIFPLFDSASELVDSISDLFVSTSFYLFAYYPESSDKLEPHTVQRTASEDFLKKLIDTQPKLAKFSFWFRFNALKKATTSIDFKHEINVTLERYHYRITLEDTKLETRLPYGRVISNSDINMLIKGLKKEIIQEVKNAINID
ncbi:Fic family protein [Pedobacter sp. HDW13]|uniref:Fic family protein n=1 Tax=Pedobacter sp. HDW13 TaxID=2714940 RepID=UPI00140C18A9|nr:Fic family protein [Pedobacter sp. HDW13]QIL38321.1 Fic family protein [Pedobacter sp. HDW13]